MNILDIDSLLHIGVVMSVTLFSVYALTPFVIRIAHRNDWLAHPRKDRWHATPTALMGGIAIFVGATIGALVAVSLSDLWVVWTGATLMFITGFIDDRISIRPEAKLATQVVATGVLLYGGVAFGDEWPLWLSLPVTLVWVVGITNAVNLLDNMDGLAAGVSGIAAFVLTVFAVFTGDAVAAAIGAVLVGATGGFLWYNFKPADVFMGDCGSLFLGFVIAALGLVIQQNANVGGHIAVALVPLAVLAVPIFDTTLVTFVRKLAGRPVSKGGQDHSSHRLVFLGLSERAAVLALYAISLITGSLAVVVLFVDVTLFYAIAALVTVALVVLGIHLSRADVYGATSQGDGASPSRFEPLSVLYNLFGDHWKALFGILADTLLIAAAFVVAHHVRYDAGLTEATRIDMLRALPVVLATKIAVFYGGGLYRGIWRHAGTPEVIRTVLSTFGASLAAVAAIALVPGLENVALSVMFIDWMIVTMAVLGVRFGFRGLRQYLSSKSKSGRNALLYGAGDAGTLTLREVRQNETIHLNPVGFLDDDPLKHGQRVQGLKVLGAGDDLEHVADNYDIEVLVIATTKMSNRRKKYVYNVCTRAGIECRIFAFELKQMDESPAVSEASVQMKALSLS